jgi:hypothetical protein
VRASLMRGRPARPVHTAGFTNAAALAASVPVRSRTLGHTILIGRKHRSTLLISDGRPSGAPAQKSKQRQDHESDPHRVLLLCRSWKHAITLFCTAPRKMRDRRGNRHMTASEPALNVSYPATSAGVRMAFSGTTDCQQPSLVGRSPAQVQTRNARYVIIGWARCSPFRRPSLSTPRPMGSEQRPIAQSRRTCLE